MSTPKTCHFNFLDVALFRLGVKNAFACLPRDGKTYFYTGDSIIMKEDCTFSAEALIRGVRPLASFFRDYYTDRVRSLSDGLAGLLPDMDCLLYRAPLMPAALARYRLLVRGVHLVSKRDIGEFLPVLGYDGRFADYDDFRKGWDLLHVQSLWRKIERIQIIEFAFDPGRSAAPRDPADVRFLVENL